ncbi:hypothetical protein GOP47_0006429 [Adiantum capillus-veneris]|uniref:t-SNARE coiled-coil homology domain-containing protein n=1 Tax=Adiantum capillus-veneris TaxID=13818 RepID=A0A9D4ZKA4_ADICA|nr:hypothetical protein GOP47_0006429 [Adiantum capillus-veneris]
MQSLPKYQAVLQEPNEQLLSERQPTLRSKHVEPCWWCKGALIEERDQGIREIQQQIGEVNEIFKGLAVLVHEQGVMIDDIDSNIETSHAATAQANRQLTKAAKSQKSNSSLLGFIQLSMFLACLPLVIFGIVLLIVIIVLAT